MTSALVMSKQPVLSQGSRDGPSTCPVSRTDLHLPSSKVTPTLVLLYWGLLFVWPDATGSSNISFHFYKANYEGLSNINTYFVVCGLVEQSESFISTSAEADSALWLSFWIGLMSSHLKITKCPKSHHLDCSIVIIFKAVSSSNYSTGSLTLLTSV